MKKILLTVLIGLSLVTSAMAYVNVTGYSYDRTTQSFTINVKASEPWIVWRTFSLWGPWKQITPVMGVGRSKQPFVDEGVGLVHPYAFYAVVPKGKYPNNGNHFGWEQPQNPHSQE